MARLRFEIISIASLGTGVHRLPVNCWRMTIWAYPQSSLQFFLEGTDFAPDMKNVLTDDSYPFHAVFGGVILNEKPVNLDQVLTVTAKEAPGAGILLLEYLEE